MQAKESSLERTWLGASRENGFSHHLSSFFNIVYDLDEQ